MYDDGSAFLFRYRLFLRELQAGSFPNASTLATLAGCSSKTAQRAIEKFQERFFLPIEFCAKRKGYRLVNSEFLNGLPPLEQEELLTLLLMRNLAKNLHSDELRDHLDSVWLQLTNRLGGTVAHLESVSSHFSADTTSLQVLQSVRILDLVSYAAAGNALNVTYRSPWKQTSKTYLGRVVRVHLSDGAVYFLFRDYRNREFVLNAAFVLEMVQSGECLPDTSITSDVSDNAESWLDGFGVWAGAEIVRVEIGIRRPAADFYAKQVWHREQIDDWREDAVIRTLPSVISPELVRRILSLGEHVCAIGPPALRSAVLEAAQQLIRNIDPK